MVHAYRYLNLPSRLPTPHYSILFPQMLLCHSVSTDMTSLIFFVSTCPHRDADPILLYTMAHGHPSWHGIKTRWVLPRYLCFSHDLSLFLYKGDWEMVVEPPLHGCKNCTVKYHSLHWKWYQSSFLDPKDTDWMLHFYPPSSSNFQQNLT